MWPASRRVHGWDGLDGHDAERGAITDGGFEDVAESLASQQASGPRRHHQVHVSEQAQRRHVEVIHVDVGDQHDIDVTEDFHVDVVVPPQVGDSGRQRRIGEEPDTADVDEGAGVAEPADLQAIVGGHGRERRSRISK